MENAKNPRNYPLLIASAILALIVGGGGIAKLAGVPEVHASFGILGLPGWFGYFIGTCELLGAIALFIRPLSALAGLGLSAIMAGAVYFHALHTPIAEGIPAMLALALALFVARQQRSFILKFGSSDAGTQ